MTEYTITFKAGKTLTPGAVINIACAVLELPMETLAAGNRKRSHVEARAIIAAMLKKHFRKDATSQRIADYFNFDHTSVIHLHGLVEDMLYTRNAFFCEKYEAVDAAINQFIEQLNATNE